jgi:peptide/nickel transport system ATP-binding protein
MCSSGGSVPRGEEVEGECAFAERCAWTEPACRTGRPPLEHIDAGQFSRCRRWPEIEGELDRARVRPSTAPPAVPAVAAADAVVSVRGLVKRFASTVHAAVDGIDITVGPGECVGLVGESGSGKTTVARCIAGLELPSSGSVAFAPGAGPGGGRGALQMVFQDPYSSLNPARTVGATLSEALRLAGRPAGRREVALLLERVGMAPAGASVRPAKLSGGQRQRVAIARAIALEPALIVCDEPVSALDVSVQAQILALFRDLHESLGMSSLFITHDLGVVRQVADRVYVMRVGRIVEAGPTGVVLDRPADGYTRRLLAAIPKRSAWGGPQRRGAGVTSR